MCYFQFLFLQGICLEVVLLGNMVVLFLVFNGISLLSFIVAVSTYIPPAVQKGSHFCTHSPALVVCLNDGHFDQHEMVSHCNFDFHFSNNEMLSISSCVY